MSKNYGVDQHGNPVDVTRGDLVRFYPDTLLPFIGNYRWSATDTDPAIVAARDVEIEAMVCSLCTEGQKNPIIIHGVSGNRFRVHAGDTRHQAFLRIDERRIWPFSEDGRPRVECRVEANGDPKRTFGTSIVENVAHNVLNIIDLANAVAIATDEHNYTDAEILQKFQQAKPDGTAKDPAWLPNMRRLARLPIERKREIYLGLMAASVGYLLAEIPEDRHAEVLAEAAGETLAPVPVSTLGYDPDSSRRNFERSVIESEEADGGSDPRAETYSELHPREDGDVIILPRQCPDCGPTEPNPVNNSVCGVCHQPYNYEAVENPAPPAQTLDYSESQTAPVIQPNKQPKKRKKVTARAVAEVAKSKGLLQHKKVGHTLAGMREFWTPMAHERNADTRLGHLAAASLAWMEVGDDDAFYKQLLKILKEAK